MTYTFCPNKNCKLHHSFQTQKAIRVHHLGYYDTRVAGRVHRYRCLSCGKTFSDRTFSIDYYTKKSLPYHEINTRLASSESVSAIGRNLGVSANAIINRISRLGRNCFYAHRILMSELKLREAIVADGFESFDQSQYFPSHLPIVVGKHSQVIYSFSHTNTRRKGRMTVKQRAKRDALDERWKPEYDGIAKAMHAALQVVIPQWDKESLPTLEIHTDDHASYPKVIKRLTVGDTMHSINHVITPGSLPKNLNNKLFAVNYMDREFRKDIASYHRKSACTVRNVNNGLLRLSVYQFWHNYIKDYRIRGSRNDTRKHAEVAGLDRKQIDAVLKEVYCKRSFLSRTSLPEWSRKIWLCQHRTALKNKPDYLQGFFT